METMQKQRQSHPILIISGIILDPNSVTRCIDPLKIPPHPIGKPPLSALANEAISTADESSLSKCSTVEARHRLRAPCAGAAWRDTHTDSDDNSDSAANTTTKGKCYPVSQALYDI